MLVSTPMGMVSLTRELVPHVTSVRSTFRTLAKQRVEATEAVDMAIAGATRVLFAVVAASTSEGTNASARED